MSFEYMCVHVCVCVRVSVCSLCYIHSPNVSLPAEMREGWKRL